EFWWRHRTAEAESELIALDGVASGKEVSGVQLIIAKILEQAAVKLVRARAGNDVDHATNTAPVLRVERARLDTELLDGIRTGKRQRDVGEAVVVVAVVKHIIRAHAARAVDRDGNDVAREGLRVDRPATCALG